MSEKPYAATPERMRKARSEGDLPKAQELANLCSFLAIAIGTGVSADAFAQWFAAMFTAAVAGMPKYVTQTALAPGTLLPNVFDCVQRLLLLIMVGMVAGIGVALSVTRGALQGISLKFDRIAPVPQFKQLFSGATVGAFWRAGVSACLAVALLVPSLLTLVSASIGLRTPREVCAQLWAHVWGAMAILACVGLGVAGLEVAAALRKRGKKLRMSFDEIKRESKEQNGDPHMRMLRKRRHRARLRGGPAAARSATVVITNPTHIAVALLYAPPQVPVPRVVACGADDEAREIRLAARDSGVAIIEHVPLARRLWAQCDVGETIPLETYALVAPIVAAAMHAKAQERS